MNSSYTSDDDNKDHDYEIDNSVVKLRRLVYIPNILHNKYNYYHFYQYLSYPKQNQFF